MKRKALLPNLSKARSSYLPLPLIYVLILISQVNDFYSIRRFEEVLLSSKVCSVECPSPPCCWRTSSITMSPQSVVLRENPSPEDDSWVFNCILPRSNRADLGKHISFTPEKITLSQVQFPENRMLKLDDRAQFVLLSFERLRFADRPGPSATRDYMIRLFDKGLILNGNMYRFYGHSNSQLVRHLMRVFTQTYSA